MKVPTDDELLAIWKMAQEHSLTAAIRAIFAHGVDHGRETLAPELLSRLGYDDFGPSHPL